VIKEVRGVSKSNKWVLALIVISVAALFVLFVAVAVGYPITDSAGYRCPYCGARVSRLHVLGLKTRETITTSDLSRYWLKHVDPRHRHTWVRLCGNYNMGFGATYDSPGWTHERWQLKDEVTLAVLRSLPSARERKQFMTDMWGTGLSRPKAERDRTFWFVHELKCAYDQNPTRTDWPTILKKHGYYP